MSYIEPLPCVPCGSDINACACNAADAEVSTVGASISAVLVAAANPNRLNVILWNNSTATAYLKFGLGASSTDFTWKIASQSGYELPAPVYIGDLTAAWDAATGSMQITELM